MFSIINNRRLDRIDRGLEIISNKLDRVLFKEKRMAASLNDIADAVTAEKTVVNSAITLLGQLHQMLTDALASNDPGKMQAVLDALASNKQTLADAVVANTPAA